MQARSKRPVIIHAGFHKTGTTTVQTVLKAQRQRLSQQVRVVLKSDIPTLCQAARVYADAPCDARLEAFRTEAADCFGSPSPDDTRPVLISAEDLCGVFPGRRGRIGYPHAKALLGALIGQMADDCTPHINLSTRAALPWLKSCYAHNLHHARMRLTQDAFIAAHAGPALQDIADDIASSLDGVPVTTAALEQTGSLPEGPLTPLLDLLDIPPPLREHRRSSLVANPSLPPDIQAAFLLLNREVEDDLTRNASKKQLIADYRSGRK